MQQPAEKRFDKLNYYEMLDLKPNATFFEIRHAYNNALQIYQTDSLISYSFFTPEERREILGLLEKAYLTLINDEKRQLYNDELIRLGVMSEVVRKPAVKMPVSIFDIKRQQGNTGAGKSAATELKSKVGESKLISEIISQQLVSGEDLMRIRNELAITLECVARQTKIRIDYLRSIEEENIESLPATVFLKGFLKAYLKCLCLEPVEKICTKYLNHLASSGKKV